MLDDLRQLQAAITVAIDLLERLQPTLSAWKGDSLQEALGSPPGAGVASAGKSPV